MNVRSARLLVLILCQSVCLLSVLPGRGMAAGPDDDAAVQKAAVQKAAVQKLQFLVGTWEATEPGTATVHVRTVTMSPDQSQVHIRATSVDSARLNEEEKPEGSSQGRAVLTCDPQGQTYLLKSRFSDGRTREYTAELVQKAALVIAIPETVFGAMRFRMTVTDGVWKEMLDVQDDQGKWSQMYEMKFQKTEKPE